MALKVLALHGFGQNAEVFIEKRAKEVCRKLKSVATIHALNAPYTLPYDSSLRAWFVYPEDVWDGRAETINSLVDILINRDSFEGVGFRESFDLLLSEWQNGSYDGILGFSQGVVPATALCSELHLRGSPPRFAILISGYGKPVPRGISCYPPSAPLPIPSLHMWGAADDHIPPWTSEVLAGFFETPKKHAHAGGHFMPQKAPDIAVIQDFLAAFVAPDAPGKALKSKTKGNDAKPQGKKTSSTANESQSTAASQASGHLSSKEELSNYLLCYAAAGFLWQHEESTSEVAPVDAAPPVEASSKSTLSSSDYLPEELEGPGMSTHERLLALLRNAAVEYKFLGPHAACRTSEDSVQVRLAAGWEGTTLHSGAKAMLLQTAKSGWCLAVVPADRKLSWKKVRAIYGKGTRMATEEEVSKVAGCVPGAVPPFAAAFPAAAECVADLDLPDVINFNCGSRYRSISMSKADYAKIQAPQFLDICD